MLASSALAGAMWIGTGNARAEVDLCAVPLPGAVVLTEAPDVFTGGPGPESIYALGGDDIIAGGGGDDLICAGSGADSISGLEGRDMLDGGAGDDTLSYAFDPAPVFVSQASQQATDGWGWPDRLASIESIRGSNHADVLVGDERSTTFAGGPGDDRIAARAGVDVIEGDAGRDHLYGGRDDDLVSFRAESRRVKVYLGLGYALAGSRRDDLVAIEGAVGSRYGDVLVGDAGPNRFMGLNGTDSIDGGGGVDVVEYDSIVDPADGELVDAGPATVDLSTGRGQSAGDPGHRDKIAHVEGVQGSSADDRLTGALGSNLLVGLEGDDALGGGRGGDVLNGGPGSDRLHGGRGKGDSTHYLFETELETGIEADLNKGENEGQVRFGSDLDSLAGIEILLGSNQNDKIRGGPGRDLIRSEDGVDRVHGLDGNDVLFPGRAEDHVDGGAGRDRCIPPEEAPGIPPEAAPGAEGARSCESEDLPGYLLAEIRRTQLYLLADHNCAGNRKCTESPHHPRPCRKHPRRCHHRALSYSTTSTLPGRVDRGPTVD